MLWSAATALAWPVSLAVTVAAMCVPHVPLSLALVPLLLAIWQGTPGARVLGIAVFIAPAAALCTSGLIGTGIASFPAISGALAFCAVVSAVPAVTGIVVTGVLLAAIPFFPASPVAAIAACVPGFGLTGLVAAGLALAAVEAMRSKHMRTVLALPLAVAAPVTETLRSHSSDSGGWKEMPEPATITERVRWIALRDSMPPGSEVILGENVFDARDSDALSFWCDVAVERHLVLYIGVADPASGYRRGTVWRLDSEACHVGRQPGWIEYEARIGIPLLTGTWSSMAPFRASESESAVDWLLCLEAFLPRTWAPLLTSSSDRPVVVLSNDAAFDAVAPGSGSAPVRTLRRKAAAAMASLSGRTVLHAETGQTFLVHEGSER